MAAKSALKKNQGEEHDYDQYGFYLPLSRIKIHLDKGESKKINARVEKWRKMLPSIETLIVNSDKKLKSRIRKGIPDAIRIKVWPHLAQIENIKKKYSFNQLIQSPAFPYQIDIEADLNRTFPNHQLFQNKNKIGLNALSNVLKAVSIAHEDMGYCQGLNFIAAAFIIYLSDEEAFFLIISMLENYDCEKMYLDVASIHKQLFVHDQLVKKFFPEISALLAKNCIESVTYATGWYMTLFSSVLPFRFFLRIMDIFFLEKWKIIYRVTLTILKLKKSKLLACKTFEGLYLLLKDFSDFEKNEIEEDKFFKIACSDFTFSQKLIDDLERQYEKSRPKLSISKKKKNKPQSEIGNEEIGGEGDKQTQEIKQENQSSGQKQQQELQNEGHSILGQIQQCIIEPNEKLSQPASDNFQSPSKSNQNKMNGIQNENTLKNGHENTKDEQIVHHPKVIDSTLDLSPSITNENKQAINFK